MPKELFNNEQNQLQMTVDTNLPSASKFPKVNVIPNLIGLKKTSIDCTKHKYRTSNYQLFRAILIRKIIKGSLQNNVGLYVSDPCIEMQNCQVEHEDFSFQKILLSVRKLLYKDKHMHISRQVHHIVKLIKYIK